MKKEGREKIIQLHTTPPFVQKKSQDERLLVSQIKPEDLISVSVISVDPRDFAVRDTDLSSAPPLSAHLPRTGTSFLRQRPGNLLRARNGSRPSPNVPCSSVLAFDVPSQFLGRDGSFLQTIGNLLVEFQNPQWERGRHEKLAFVGIDEDGWVYGRDSGKV